MNRGTDLRVYSPMGHAQDRAHGVHGGADRRGEIADRCRDDEHETEVHRIAVELLDERQGISASA